MIDFNGINAQIAASADRILEDWLPGGYWDKGEYKPCNPVRGDKNPGSFCIDGATGRFIDFADPTTAKGGDFINLYAYIKGLSQGDAAKQLKDYLNMADTLPPVNRSKVAPIRKTKDKPQPIIPVPKGIPDPDFNKRGKPSQVWTYRTRAGGLMGYVLRIDRLDESKDFYPLFFFANGWKFAGITGDNPRPIYRQEELDRNPEAKVLICEGEKAADAGQRLFSDYVVLSWLGGSGAAKKVDWSVLKDRDVVIWPDNDEAGVKAASAIQSAIPNAYVVQLPDSKPKGWDLADAEAEGLAPSALRPLLIRPKPKATDEWHNNQFYKVLGFQQIDSRALFMFYNKRTASVVSYRVNQLNKEGLQELAPIRFWESMATNYESKTARFDAIRERLVDECYRRKIYNPDRIRGRGAWMESERVVMHTGDMLIVDGIPTSLMDYDSRYVYEQSHKLDLECRALSTEESEKFVSFCLDFAWEQALHGFLLAGWIFLAPVCGALSWRPHLWLTGPIGSGKSWIFQNVIQEALGDFSLQVQSETTEAGLRQRLGNAALPVIFDEAETENRRNDQRIQNVMALMRQASSESGGGILKGSANGDAKEYRIRSMFAFASVLSGVFQSSDKSRIAILNLRNPNGAPEAKARFEAIKKTRIELYQPDYLNGLRYRAVSKIPFIRECVALFSEKVMEKVGTRRLGDQYGTLLAGAWAAANDHLPTPDEINEIILSGSWEDESALATELDHDRFIKHLLQHSMRIQGDKGPMDTTIGELLNIETLTNPLGLSDAIKNPAKATLARYGLKVDDGYLFIQNSNSQLARVFRDTPWPKNWRNLLKSCPGSHRPQQPVYYGAGFGGHRAIGVPLAALGLQVNEVDY